MQRHVLSLKKKYRIFLTLCISISACLVLLGCGKSEESKLKWVKGTLKEPDLRTYVPISLDDAKLVASSQHLDVTKSTNVIDGNYTSYWHVKHPRTAKIAWIRINLPLEFTLSALRIKPRQDANDQFWVGKGATLFGSNDGKNWAEMVGLESPKAMSKGKAWILFEFPGKAPYRSYKLKIKDPGFLSFSEIEFYKNK